MLSPHKFIDEVITSLRNIIAPAIADPYPKAQAYMAAIILQYVARQVEERTDLVAEKQQELTVLFHDVGQMLLDHNLSQVASTVLDHRHSGTVSDPTQETHAQEEHLCRLIEALYAHREEIGPQLFGKLNQRVRASLRRLLDQELKVVK